MKRQYTIDEIVEITGFKRRTIRYYVHAGLIEPPAGRGRGGFYNDSHVQILLQIKAMQEKGMGISAIAPLLKKEDIDPVIPSRHVMARYEIVPGLELTVSRDLEMSQSSKIMEIIKIVRAIAKGEISHDK